MYFVYPTREIDVGSKKWYRPYRIPEESQRESFPRVVGSKQKVSRFRSKETKQSSSNTKRRFTYAKFNKDKLGWKLRLAIAFDKTSLWLLFFSPLVVVAATLQYILYGEWKKFQNDCLPASDDYPRGSSNAVYAFFFSVENNNPLTWPI